MDLKQWSQVCAIIHLLLIIAAGLKSSFCVDLKQWEGWERSALSILPSTLLPTKLKSDFSSAGHFHLAAKPVACRELYAIISERPFVDEED